jgi:hypothetical protein
MKCPFGCGYESSDQAGGDFDMERHVAELHHEEDMAAEDELDDEMEFDDPHDEED